MTAFLLNILLALAWAAAGGRFSVPSLLLGFAISYLLLAWLYPRLAGPTSYFRKLPQAVGFVIFMLWELCKSNLQVAWEVITPWSRRRPGIVAVPLEVHRDVEITLLANLITLTPGTLSLHVSPDRRTLYVHAMFVEDPDALRRQIKDGFERRVLNLLR